MAERMKFSSHVCHECGETAAGTLEDVEARADLDFDEDGTAVWSGNTEMLGDTQKTRLTNGLVTLMCENGHEWQASMIEVD